MQPSWTTSIEENFVVYKTSADTTITYEIPDLRHGLIQWVNQFASVYYATPNQETFSALQPGQMPAAWTRDFFLTNWDNIARLKYFIGHKSYLFDAILNENWNIPILICKIDQQCYPITGNGRIGVHNALKKPIQNCKCIVLDYDKDFKGWNVEKILLTDDDLSTCINNKIWYACIQFRQFKDKKFFYPEISNISVDQDEFEKYDEQYYSLGEKNYNFVKSIQNENQQLTIFIHDKHDSKIYDSSGLFEIKNCEIELGTHLTPNEIRHNSRFGLTNASLGNWYFHTNKKITFDLSNLIFYLRKDHNLYYTSDNDFITWIQDQDYLDKQVHDAK